MSLHIHAIHNIYSFSKAQVVLTILLCGENVQIYTVEMLENYWSLVHIIKVIQ